MTIPFRPFRRSALLLPLAALCATAPAAALEDSRTLREVKTFTAAGGPRVVEVDGFRGSITATATRGGDVEIVIHEKVTGRSREEIAEARRKITLDRSQEGNRVKLYVNGPFRCGPHNFCGDRDPEKIGQRVTYDLELRVPAGTRIDLQTVFGDVRVDGTDGPFIAASVMGRVEMSAVRGAGTARSVNGPVKVAFAENPGGDCRFETVNGKVDVAFRPGLAADLSFKTLNGEVYTDFPYVMRNLAKPEGERRDDRFVLRRSGASGIRIGDGGPELAFATVNGDILIRDQASKETSR
jgi:hypothetical protein